MTNALQIRFPGFEMFHADRLACEVGEFDWPFLHERAADIERCWDSLLARKPAVYNGRVFLTCGWTLAVEGGDRIVRSRHFETDFKSFMAWRDLGFPDASVCNSFAAAALRGADGGYVLGVMGEHTANAGQIYFPCGTPDPSDRAGDTLDMAGSVFRELEEETGLGASVVRPGRDWTIVANGPYLAFLLDVTSPLSSMELAARAAAHIAGEERPELARIHCVRSRSDLQPDVMPSYITAFLESRLDQRPP